MTFSGFERWPKTPSIYLRLGGVWSPKRHFGPKRGFWGGQAVFIEIYVVAAPDPIPAPIAAPARIPAPAPAPSPCLNFDFDRNLSLCLNFQLQTLTIDSSNSVSTPVRGDTGKFKYFN